MTRKQEVAKERPITLQVSGPFCVTSSLPCISVCSVVCAVFRIMRPSSPARPESQKERNKGGQYPGHDSDDRRVLPSLAEKRDDPKQQGDDSQQPACPHGGTRVAKV